MSHQSACTMHRKDQLDAMVQNLSFLGSFYRILSKLGLDSRTGYRLLSGTANLNKRLLIRS